MSRVYFHSQHGTAELRGSERAYADFIVTSLTTAALDYGAWPGRSDPLEQFIRNGPRDPKDLGMHLRHSNTHFELPDGQKIDGFALTLNTAVIVGNDVIRLLARLHGQCEVHGYVEGPHRAWLASVISRGRADNILRSDAGWEAVGALLASRDDEPVVTSYSVTDQFPNAYVAGYTDDTRGVDTWYELPRRGSMGAGDDRDAKETRVVRMDARDVCQRRLRSDRSDGVRPATSGL